MVPGEARALQRAALAYHGRSQHGGRERGGGAHLHVCGTLVCASLLPSFFELQLVLSHFTSAVRQVCQVGQLLLPPMRVCVLSLFVFQWCPKYRLGVPLLPRAPSASGLFCAGMAGWSALCDPEIGYIWWCFGCVMSVSFRLPRS